MSWRPEGWKQPDTYCQLASVEYIRKLSKYEAGADAMLEAVCKEIEKVGNPPWEGELYCQLANVICIPKESNYYKGCGAQVQKILALLRSEK